MATQLSQDLVDRLVCAKYMFRRSCELLDRGGPFSSGMAVSGFQDSAELFLRVIAEHLHVSLRESAAFNQIIDAIDEVSSGSRLSHRTSLNQLNKARTNFKHFGLEPKEQDARKFRRDLEAFFPLSAKQFFGIDFEDVSLIGLVGHRRTENFLRQAEKLMEQEDYDAAVTSCAIAFALFRLRSKWQRSGRLDLDPFSQYGRSELRPLLDNLRRVLEDQQLELDILMNGINPIDFRRFDRLTPRVTFSMAGTIYLDHPPGVRIVHDREAALFCLRFSLDAILSMKSIDIPPSFPAQPLKPTVRVIKQSPAIVSPQENPPETIRDVEVGEVFPGILSRGGKYVEIVLDGDPAYVNRDAIEELPIRSGTS